MNFISEIIGYKDLLYNLTMKELKLKYKNSILGIIWSLFNPLMMIVIYSIAFKIILKIQIENYSVFVFAGLLPWIFFQNSISQSISSIINNSALITKVYFPRSILPISVIMANFINFLITLVILFGAVLISGIKLSIYLFLLPILLIFLLGFVIGIGLLLSALNTKYRDIAYLMEVVFTAWFYLTPIIYSLSMVPQVVKIYILCNPLTSYIESFRSIIIDGTLPDTINIIIIVLSSIIALLLGIVIFKTREKHFVDEL